MDTGTQALALATEILKSLSDRPEEDTVVCTALGLAMNAFSRRVALTPTPGQALNAAGVPVSHLDRSDPRARTMFKNPPSALRESHQQSQP
jgi:hypothetical protein